MAEEKTTVTAAVPEGLPDMRVLSTVPELVVCPAGGAEQVEGRRSFIEYFDFGVRKATSGAMSAQIMRMKSGLEAPTGWHYHTVELQMTYILKGWTVTQFEDGAVQRLEQGSLVLLPGGHRHNELDIAPDAEIMEILMGEMGTVLCEAPPGL